MPRPSKHISPDTLGGRIRAAREHLQLSLADVAKGHYSTSLISQIERNRVDPSQESLRYLAERLQLPLEDLTILAQQHRPSEVDAAEYRSFEELRSEAARFFDNRQLDKALDLLKDLRLSHVPPLQRWRLAALRGECYFKQRQFFRAQQDFVYALEDQPQPEWLPTEQKRELFLLHLHLASTYRELQQLKDAQEQYELTLSMARHETPFGYVAETHWGIALIFFAQTNKLAEDAQNVSKCKQEQLNKALEHARIAHVLYHSIHEDLRAASLTCLIAQIQRAMNQIDQVYPPLQEILATWGKALDETPETPAAKQRQQEELNVVSAAACILAGIELERGNLEQARKYSELALRAGQSSYKLRRAEAYMIQGQVLAAINLHDPKAEQAFRNAVSELADTDRLAVRINAHILLGRHLLKLKKFDESDREFARAGFLPQLVPASDASADVLTEEALRS